LVGIFVGVLEAFLLGQKQKNTKGKNKNEKKEGENQGLRHQFRCTLVLKNQGGRGATRFI